MAAFQFTPGPIDMFCGFRATAGGAIATYSYLGTAVVAPSPEIEQFKIPVMNDLGGRSVPFQLVQDGETGSLVTTINRFDRAVMNALAAQSSGGAGLGAESGIARGTLVIGVSDFEFVLKNRYYNQAVAGGTVPMGYRFYSANTRKAKPSTEGTRVEEWAIALDFQNVYVPSTGGFFLFTTDLSGLSLTPN